MSDTEVIPRRPGEEERLAKALLIGLPLVTLSIAAVVGVLVGPATSILVIAAGLLLGVISLLWGSLRVLTGDAPLAPELEALEMSMQGFDGLAGRKKMLLRALKDLDIEKGLGKIEQDDYEQLALNHRAELKTLLRLIDATLEPHRGKAENAARAYLVKAGVTSAGYRGELVEKDADESSPDLESTPSLEDNAPPRVACPKCKASNEPDAKFCKECATTLSPALRTEKMGSASATGETSDEA